MNRVYIGMLIGLFVAVITGCGKQQLAKVHGKVTYGGQPVTNGTLIFSPIANGEDQRPGKSSTGDIQPDGSFRLSTHRAQDGAYVGRHHIRFVPSIDDKKSASSPRSSGNYANLDVRADYVIEVVSGTDNEINVDLIKRAAN